MKINQSMSILFWLAKAKKTADGKVPIYCRITIDGVRAEVSTGKTIAVDDERWIADLGYLKGNLSDAQEVNKELSKIKVELQKYYDRLDASYEHVSSEMVKNAYNGIEKTKKLLVAQVFKAHNKMMRERVDAEVPTLKEKTWQRFETTKQKVGAFLEHEYKQSDMYLANVPKSFGEDFKHYLTTVGKLKMNTAMKYIKNTKQVFEFAANKEWLSSNNLASIKCSYKQPKRTKLTWDEIIKIYNHKPLVGRLEEVRDVYIFTCFTGYSYQDIYLLSPENVINWIDGKKWLIKDRFKTDAKSNVPLLDIPLQIIAKYKEHPYCIREQKLLPVDSNQRYNGYLKEIAAICSINKNLTTHTARHTFATTVLLENDCPLETVKEMLGHENIRTTQIYAQITDVKIKNNMKDVKTRIGKKLMPIKLSKIA